MSTVHLEMQYLYVVIIAPFLVVWALLFAFSRNTRRMQLRMSVVFGLVGIIVENMFYMRDYWIPPSILPITIGPASLYPEFFLYGAAFGGIAATVYPFASRVSPQSAGAGGKWKRLLIGVSLFVAVSVGMWAAGMNSIFATAAGACAVTVLGIAGRRDLIAPALASGSVMALLMFLFYFVTVTAVANIEEMFASTWRLYGGALGGRIAGVPVSELVWGFSAGSAVGVFYPYVRNVRYTSMNRRAETAGIEEFRAIVRGRVQRVMFRDFTVRKAQSAGITGFVRNLRDGSVEVIAQGRRDALEHMIAHLRVGPLLASVASVEVTWREPATRFDSFELVY